MIFVTVGNAKQPFLRFLNAIEDMARKDIFAGHEVIIQAGYNKDFYSESFRIQPFFTMEEFENNMANADLIISHGGCGTLLKAVQLGKAVVVVPRLKRFAEHINDHQLQLLDALSGESNIFPVYDMDRLKDTILNAMQLKRDSLSIRPPSLMPEAVGKAIRDLLIR